ncbi:monovalent cation/H+ antiporter subunit D family protein [Coriobacteriia bacterium Es71-Z0120]|uniref:monovalent cation/H+ antiporter subunit D family protein n=1 Tax=Parvivirga hydrogeniphila TaxID=2939460 RepID=UPI00226088F9|nr:monovalent cation/H+ antiporter subunit D family protein [Parvivirga hydrogeniphila]MCL4078656.1 monovalent cation/H+ antiporter subunit D family protein [Parvivirga hydrogeniphila]
METVDVRVVLAPAISFTCAGLVFLMGRSVFWRRFWSLGAATLKLAVVMSMLPGALAGKTFVWDLIEFTPGIGIAFRADALGMFFATVSSALWLVTTVYAIGYMEPEQAKVRFFGFFALCVSTTVGVAFAENLLTLFVFYETLTICTYPLVIHEETPEALRAGRKYLAYTLSGGACILLGSALTYQVAGTLTLSRSGILPASADPRTLAVLFATLIVGFGVKAAIMPLHGWLPTAMVAPTPVSALLHAVAVVKVGAFGILRVVYNVFGIELLRSLGFTVPLAYLAAFTIVVASVVALFQDNLKRRLAYSTVSQLSYIVLGASLLAPSAACAAVAHIANQAFAKITMFFVAGAIQRTTGKTQVHELAGIGHEMPLTMAAFTAASLSFIGVPLFAGFITKWYLSLGALESGMWWFAIVMLASSLLNAAYWLPIVYLAFFKGSPERRPEVREARPLLLVPTLVCAVWVIVLGTTSDVPGMPFALARAAVEFVFKM